jgi:hypothetical protein
LIELVRPLLAVTPAHSASKNAISKKQFHCQRVTSPTPALPPLSHFEAYSLYKPGNSQKRPNSPLTILYVVSFYDFVMNAYHIPAKSHFTAHIVEDR